MKKDLFLGLYKQVGGLEVNDCPPQALSRLLHGYLSVYSMVRVYPWLEDDLGTVWDIHDRIREIARVLQQLVTDKDIPVDTRAGYVVDLMDAYQLYSDMTFLDTALDVAYEILVPQGEDRMVLPCRTANVCRLLCNCYYFTREEECGLLARGLVTEALGLSRKFDCDELVAWWYAFRVYDCVVEEMEMSKGESEYFLKEFTRLEVNVEQIEDEMIESFQQMNGKGLISLFVDVFDVLATREFAMYNEVYNQKLL